MPVLYSRLLLVKMFLRYPLPLVQGIDYTSLRKQLNGLCQTKAQSCHQKKPDSVQGGSREKPNKSAFPLRSRPSASKLHTILTVIRRSQTRLLNTLSHYWLSNFKQNSPALLRTAGGVTPNSNQRTRSNQMISNDVVRGNRAPVLPSSSSGGA